MEFGKMKSLLSLFICSYFLRTQGKISYDGHTVLRVSPKSEDDLNQIKDLFSEGFDIWRESTKVGAPTDVRLSPDQIVPVLEKLTNLDLHHEVMISDVQSAADLQQTRSSPCCESFNYSSYHTLDEINNWISQTVTTYPDITEAITVSESYEERSIKGIKISTGSTESPRSALWIQGGIHAREWISPATVIYMTSKLLQDYNDGLNSPGDSIVTGFDWYIVPVLNVDGYVYTWEEDRMWRKTRSINMDSSCVGVDPNRNWDHGWGANYSGSSGNPCSSQYRGTSPFSEPCTKGASEYLLKQKSEVSFKGFLDFHSYSQLWMSPWGYSKDKPEDYIEQDKSSVAAVDAIRSVHGTEYEHGPIATTIYPANGNSIDWAYKVLGAKFSAAIELRDKGENGFLLPKEQIEPTGEETYAGLISYAQNVLKMSK